MDAFYPTTDPQQFYQSVKKIGKLDIERMFPAHHQLIIPVSIIGRVEKAFRELEKNNLLEQGKGVFDFGEFQIHTRRAIMFFGRFAAKKIKTDQSNFDPSLWFYKREF